ncbi:hypothetical protein [Methanobacterium congolense]|uniref:Uncharacterized protein n=1 Tax=Methanobacterium congolense TaxID=118062 RepID=A0A1D3L4I1_9EURY|nr:hypothetical protein [Methanobacterium congolense]SCG86455.1 putative protein [Methanobacterium congolense]
MEISVEQCRENDRIKEIISKSGLPIKYIKLLLRISDAIYINAVNYNVSIEDSTVTILLISSKPENKMGQFNTIPLNNIFYRLTQMSKENSEVKTLCEVEDGLLKVTVHIHAH